MDPNITPVICYSDDEEIYPLDEFILKDLIEEEEYESDSTMVIDWSDLEEEESFVLDE